MSRTMTISVTLAGLLIGASVGAAPAPAQWYEQVTVKYVYAGQVGSRVAISVNSAINSGPCGTMSELVLDQSNPYFKSMLAMIMTAYTTGKSISVYTDGSCAAVGTGVLLTDVRLP